MAIPGSAHPMMMASLAEPESYQISRSLRFNSSDSAYLSRTPASAGNRRTWTWSGWVKRSTIDGGYRRIFSSHYSDNFFLRFNGNSGQGLDSIQIGGGYAGNYYNLYTTAVFRDPSAWYHIVLACNTTLVTPADRFKLWFNGVQQTLNVGADGNIPQDRETGVNTTSSHTIGVNSTGGENLAGYLADVHFIDGQALDPTSFGEFDANGIWQPKEVSITSVNDGTDWASSSYNSVTGTTGSTDMTNAFDGSLSTATSLGSGDASCSATVVFTPPSPITVTQGVRVYMGIDRGQSISINGSQTNASVSAGWNDTGFTGTLSNLSIGPTNVGSSSNINAIEIDGEILISNYDNSNGYGTNGFHLDFSDNSTTAALGTDTSGAGNDWTPNNLSVSSENGAYLSGLTASYTSCSQSKSISNMFDGSTSTIASVSGSNTHSVTYTLASGKSYSSSVRIYAAGASAAAGQRYVLLNGNRTNHNSTGWITVATGSGTINSFGTGADNTNDSGINAIEVDGVVLVSFGLDKNNDSLVDTPTNYGTDTGAGGEVRGNYATWNPLSAGAGATLSNGNLDLSTDNANVGQARSSIGVSSGKWYFEVVKTGGSANPMIGIVDAATPTSNYPGQSSGSYSYYGFDGKKYNNNSPASYGASYGTNDVIGVALDLDAGTLVFYKNGVSQGTAYSSLTGTFFPAVADDSGSVALTVTVNFGQRPFAYTAPSGFKALCTTNLPDPVVAKPNEVMDVKLYTGNGSTQTISGLGFSPDLVWLKNRTTAYGHALFDSVRGTGSLKALRVDSSTNEGNAAQIGNFANLTSFNSDGFTLGTTVDINVNNTLNDSIVAWTWDAGSSTVTNTQGSITSQVRANASAGFSIVTYTGTNAAATVGHGLNVAPYFVIVKSRSNPYSWVVWHNSFGTAGNTDYLFLESTTSKGGPGSYDFWNNIVPTSSVIHIGTQQSVNSSGLTYVAYCFAPVEGYSAFGSYTGNGSSDGPFVYTGFRPRFVIIKSYSGAFTQSRAGWALIDSERPGYNAIPYPLFANTSGAENTDGSGAPLSGSLAVDFLSNGFKPRNGTTELNFGQLIYAAFAEHPFKYARAR